MLNRGTWLHSCCVPSGLLKSAGPGPSPEEALSSLYDFYKNNCIFLFLWKSVPNFEQHVARVAVMIGLLRSKFWLKIMKTGSLNWNRCCGSMAGWCVLHSSGGAYVTATSFCEHCNESSGFIENCELCLAERLSASKEGLSSVNLV
jgi:hypothetical protein